MSKFAISLSFCWNFKNIISVFFLIFCAVLTLYSGGCTAASGSPAPASSSTAASTSGCTTPSSRRCWAPTRIGSPPSSWAGPSPSCPASPPTPSTQSRGKSRYFAALGLLAVLLRKFCVFYWVRLLAVMNSKTEHGNMLQNVRLSILYSSKSIESHTFCNDLLRFVLLFITASSLPQ